MNETVVPTVGLEIAEVLTQQEVYSSTDIQHTFYKETQTGDVVVFKEKECEEEEVGDVAKRRRDVAEEDVVSALEVDVEVEDVAGKRGGVVEAGNVNASLSRRG